MVEITQAFLFQVVGEKELELIALRARVAQLEAELQRRSSAPDIDEDGIVNHRVQTYPNPA